MPRNSLLKTSLTSLGALALVGATFTGTAFATGSHGARSGSAVTEDNDHNDGGTPNNVVDNGDNRHPSGNDRSVEHGGSGNQGASSSDPDGTSNGGADKPGGSGGYDKADQDGNNGCGNDDDFEDDNNGNCGGKAHQAEAAKPAKAEHGSTCTCDTTAAEKAKAEKAKAEKAKAEAEKAKAADTSSSHSCDRRIDERDQRAATAEVRVAKRGEVKDEHKGEVVVAPATTSTTSTTSTTAPAGVLSSELVAPPAAAPAAAPSSFGSAAVAESPTPAPAGVLSAEAVAPEVQAASVSTGSSGGVVGALSSALAFTGLNLVTFLLVALLTIALGWFLVRADRKRHA